MAEVDELTRKIAAFNTVLVYYKAADDVADGDHGRAKRLWFSAGLKKAKKKYPVIEKIVRTNLQTQAQVEQVGTPSLDGAADATAKMLADFSDYALGEYGSVYTRNLFYAIGKWIYLIDALDDYDKDLKKGAYNPFCLAYQAKSRKALLAGDKGDEIRFAFNAIFYDVRENLSHISFRFNRDLTDNILLRGLPTVTKRIMDGCNCAGKKPRAARKAEKKEKNETVK